MLQAEQEALIQEANQQVVAIRGEELRYYVYIFSQFTTQGALFAGFTVQALTNVDAKDSPSAFWWKWVYWLGSAVVMVVSLHLVLTSTLINAFGTGLALRGKAGSLIRAVDGMFAELQPQIVFFLLSVLSFQVSALGICFVLMTPRGGIACAGVFLFGLFYWYNGCMRIYNRFKADNVAWDLSGRQDSGPIMRSCDTSRTFSGHDKDLYNKQSLLAAAKERFDRNSGWVVEGPRRPDIHQNFAEGYMSARNLHRGFFAQEWTRYYFVLQKSDIYYYKSREDYMLHPKRSITNRSISVAGYFVMVTENATSGLMEISLTPRSMDDQRREWHFHVDTLWECEQWMLAFEIAGAQPSPYDRGR